MDIFHVFLFSPPPHRRGDAVGVWNRRAVPELSGSRPHLETQLFPQTEDKI